MLQETNRAFHHHSGSMEEFINSHRYSLPSQRAEDLTDGKDDPISDIRDTVPCPIIVFNIFIVLLIFVAWVWLIADGYENPVLRYLVFPILIWGCTSLCSIISRRYCRRLRMNGYPEFYERSSNAWMMNFAICSSACAIGATFYTLSLQDSDNDCWKPICNMNVKTRIEILMLFWTFSLGWLILSYGYLLCAYTRHNKNRINSDWDYIALGDTSGVDVRLPGVTEGSCEEASLVLPKGAARCGEWRGGDDISVRSKFSITSDHTLRRYRTYEASTIRRQANTIRYLEKQRKMLWTQLLQVQHADEPYSRSLDDVFLNPSPSVNPQEYQRICHEKQLLLSENQAFQLQLETKENELLAINRQLESMQVIRAKLDSELSNKQQELKEKKSKIKELLILLAVERQATEQARSFLDDFDPNGSIDSREKKRRSRKKKKKKTETTRLGF